MNSANWPTLPSFLALGPQTDSRAQVTHVGGFGPPYGSGAGKKSHDPHWFIWQCKEGMEGGGGVRMAQSQGQANLSSSQPQGPQWATCRAGLVQETQNPALVSPHCLLHANCSLASSLRGQGKPRSGPWPLPIAPGNSLPNKEGVHALGRIKEEEVTHQIRQPKT